jgi:hypothetical protein
MSCDFHAFQFFTVSCELQKTVIAQHHTLRSASGGAGVHQDGKVMSCGRRRCNSFSPAHSAREVA